MEKIPFTVSARTARLIGRENIASSKGAIIELVKNAYDADSKFCIVFFENYFSIIHERLTESHFRTLVKAGVSENNFFKVYQKKDDLYQLINDAVEVDKLSLMRQAQKCNRLYIIDAGDGMTEKIIRECWMTIGTSNKLEDVFTKRGRVKSGAKGIGRFALDKLGKKCEMITYPNLKVHEPVPGENKPPEGHLWKVNWDDFEGKFKPIDQVNAEFDGISDVTLKEHLDKKIKNEQISQIIRKAAISHGTIIEISELRENWEDFFVDQMFSDLEVLVPPKESQDFGIFLFSSLNPKKYGAVSGSICDDYDYKIVAKSDKNQNINIIISRNEYDLETIDPGFFEQLSTSTKEYQKEAFEKGYWKKNTTFSKLIPGFSEIDEDDIFNGIGMFEFTMYFMKKTYSTPDAERFNYKKFMSNTRKEWLDKFGGIKLFRDNFRVRPYGETNSTAFDWLGLGARKSRSPASIAKKDGGFKVPPDNVSGAIKISRLTNVNFEDKSSREGLQENKTFQIFKKIICSIINEFEIDRAHIAREMIKYYNEKHEDRIDREEAEKLAELILKKKSQKKGSKDDSSSQREEEKIEILAELSRDKSEEIEKLKDEQKILRGLASSGIVIASFTHELSNLSDVLGSRIDELKEMFSSTAPPENFDGTPDFFNPYVMMEDIKKQDQKIQNWLKFSIGAARKDKRKRKKLVLFNYFEGVKTTWNGVLENRHISLELNTIKYKDVEIRMFEIDLDSIFNNLIVNSIDAFIRSKEKGERIITIALSMTPKEIVIEYSDNGPGLSADIEKPEIIFEALFTTKRNKHTGDEEGTGLGMWLVNSIIKDNDGNLKLLFPKKGFGIRIVFPKKYIRRRE